MSDRIIIASPQFISYYVRIMAETHAWAVLQLAADRVRIPVGRYLG